jgi:hypothetical protein
MITESNKKILRFSSLLLFIPGIYSFYYGLNKHGVIACTNSICSFNYWNYPNAFNLMLDLIVSKFTFTYFFITGIRTIDSFSSCNKTNSEMIRAIPLTLSMIYNYNTSCDMFFCNNNCWIYYHVIFHISGTIAQINCINAIRKKI